VASPSSEEHGGSRVVARAGDDDGSKQDSRWRRRR
jgi:hypothetical protein